MRHLGAMGYIKETSLDEYQPTNFSKSLSLPMIGDGYIAMSVELSTSSSGSLPLHIEIPCCMLLVLLLTF